MFLGRKPGNLHINENKLGLGSWVISKWC